MQLHFKEKWLFQSGFSWPAAYALISASRLSYNEPATIEETAWDRWGLLASNFDVNGATGYILHGDDTLVFVFRGTDSVHDMLVDLDILRVPNSVLQGHVHKGFLQTYKDVDSIVGAALEGVGKRRVWYVGHSAGGALALLAAMHYADVGVHGVFTFGQPRLLDSLAASTVDRTLGSSYCRFAASDDLVTKVPPGFWHTGVLISFDAQGNVMFEGESLAAPMLMEEDGALSVHEFSLIQSHMKEAPAEMDKMRKEDFLLFEIARFFSDTTRHYTTRYLENIYPYAIRALTENL